LALFWLRKNGH